MPQPDPSDSLGARCWRLRRALQTASDLPPTARLTGLYLLDFYSEGENGEAKLPRPSVPHIMAELGMSKRNVYRALSLLDGRFFIRESGRAGRANRYQPVWQTQGANRGTVNESRVPPAASQGANDGVITVPPTASEKDNEKENEKGGAFCADNLPPEFNEIRKTYEDAKEASVGSVEKAWREYERIVAAGVSPIRIVQAVKRFKEKRAEQERPPFAARLAKFLAEGEWQNHEIEWNSFYEAIAGSAPEPYPGYRDAYIKSWSRLFGHDAPFPGEPGSPFPPECIPAPTPNEPSGFRVVNGGRAA